MKSTGWRLLTVRTVQKWWQPSPLAFLESVSKAKMIEAVTQACGPEATKDMPKLKKPEAVAYAASMLSGTRWLPSTLRGAAPSPLTQPTTSTPSPATND
jgi:ParB family chromosome partitioning protein